MAHALATADQLRAQIAQAQGTHDEKVQLTGQLDVDITKAEERQALRRQLEHIQALTAAREGLNSIRRRDREYIDLDAAGQNLPEDGILPSLTRSTRDLYSRDADKHNVEVLQCNKAVLKGGFEWTIEGFSWLENNLMQDDYSDNGYVETSKFVVGDHVFSLRYSPRRKLVGVVPDIDEAQRGSLAIVSHDTDGVTFRYKLFVKNGKGDFQQWGEVGNVCQPGVETAGRAFGPDVTCAEPTSAGIFGLSHEQLLQSEWVVADFLTAKVELEVRLDTGYDIERGRACRVEVPSGRITKDLRALLDDEKGSDVTFIVQGVPIKAHSQILRARSEVFDRQLCSGLRESVSNEIVIEDCDVVAFKVFLQFLYTDDFDHAEIQKSLELVIATKVNATGGDQSVLKKRALLLQHVLAVSHRYQALRLQLWCEDQLCHNISVTEVCSVLQMAHLYEAKQLENVCLVYITQHREAVMETSGFACLSQEWPAVLLKITTFVAGVPEAKVQKAIERHQQMTRQEAAAAGKRKREDSE